MGALCVAMGAASYAAHAHAHLAPIRHKLFRVLKLGGSLTFIVVGGSLSFCSWAALYWVSHSRLLEESLNGSPQSASFRPLEPPKPSTAPAPPQPESLSSEEHEEMLFYAEVGQVAELDRCKVHVANGEGVTALHRAAEAGALPSVLYLLQKGVAVDSKDHRGHLPLHLAAACGHGAIVQELIAASPLPLLQRRDAEGRSPLELIVRKVRGPKLRLLCAILRKDPSQWLSAFVEVHASKDLWLFSGLCGEWLGRDLSRLRDEKDNSIFHLLARSPFPLANLGCLVKLTTEPWQEWRNKEGKRPYDCIPLEMFAESEEVAQSLRTFFS